jgi:hypothetical protein
MASEDKNIHIVVMDNTGHTDHHIVFTDAMDVVREQMGRGKWLNIVGSDGNEEVIADFAQLKNDLKGAQDRFTDAQRLELIAALVGGVA